MCVGPLPKRWKLYKYSKSYWGRLSVRLHLWDRVLRYSLSVWWVFHWMKVTNVKLPCLNVEHVKHFLLLMWSKLNVFIFFFFVGCNSTLETLEHDVLLSTGYSLTLNNIDTPEPYTGVPNGNISDTGSIILNNVRSYADPLFGELSFKISGASSVEIMVTLQDGTDKTATVRNGYKTKILKCNHSFIMMYKLVWN